MTSTDTVQTSFDDRAFGDFSPKKLIILIRKAITYLFSKWFVIVPVAVAFGVVGYFYSTSKKVVHIAEITFAMDDGAVQSSASSLSQLRQQLGLGSLEAGGVFSSFTNIVELMHSRLLIEKTLRSSVEINGKSLLFADFFLDSLNYRDKWMKKTPYYRLKFNSPKTDKREQLFENDIIRAIYETLVNQFLKISQKGSQTTIVSVTCTTQNELFSKYFLEAFIQEVTGYYIDIKTQRTKANIAFLTHRTDSIRNILTSTMYGRATVMDANINTVRQVTSVTSDKQQTDIQILRSTYVDLSNSLEIAKANLMKETPLIQYIDTPILPLKKNAPSPLKAILLFSFLGVFITCVCLVGMKAVKFILRN